MTEEVRQSDNAEEVHEPERVSSGARRPSHARVFFLLVVILGLGVLFHAWNLTEFPPAHIAEVRHANVTCAVMHGEFRLDAVQLTPYASFHPQPFGYYALLVPVQALLGDGLTAGRILAAISAALGALVLFWAGAETGRSGVGLAGALVYSVLAGPLIAARWAFPEVTAALFVALSLASALRADRTGRMRWVLVSALTASAASVVSYWAAPALVFVIVFFAFRGVKRALLALALALSLPAAQLLFAGATCSWAFVADDWSLSSNMLLWHLGHGVGGLPRSVLWLLAQELPVVAASVILMLVTVRTRASRWALVAAALLSSGALLMPAAEGEVAHHHLLPAIPAFIVGFMAAASEFAHRASVKETTLDAAGGAPARQLVRVLAVAVLVAAPAWMSYSFVFGKFRAGKYGNYTIETGRDDMLAAATFVNEHAAPEDLVMASPLVGRYVKARVVPPRQAAAYGGLQNDRFPRRMPKGRFVYSAATEDLLFVITDPYIRKNVLAMSRRDPERKRQWAFGTGLLFAGMEEYSWPLVFRSGSLEVFANPLRYSGDVLEEHPDVLRSTEHYLILARAHDWRQGRDRAKARKLVEKAEEIVDRDIARYGQNAPLDSWEGKLAAVKILVEMDKLDGAVSKERREQLRELEKSLSVLRAISRR